MRKIKDDSKGPVAVLIEKREAFLLDEQLFRRDLAEKNYDDAYRVAQRLLNQYEKEFGFVIAANEVTHKVWSPIKKDATAFLARWAERVGVDLLVNAYEPSAWPEIEVWFPVGTEPDLTDRAVADFDANDLSGEPVKRMPLMIGLIDDERLKYEDEFSQDRTGKFKTDWESRVDASIKTQEEIEELERTLSAKSGLLRDRAQATIRLVNLMLQFTDVQNEYRTSYKELERLIFERLGQSVEATMRGKGFGLALGNVPSRFFKDRVVYYHPDLDITKDVLQLSNVGFRTGQFTPHVSGYKPGESPSKVSVRTVFFARMAMRTKDGVRLLNKLRGNDNGDRKPVELEPTFAKSYLGLDEPFTRSLMAAVREVAQANGVGLVLDVGNDVFSDEPKILFASKKLDISEQVVEVYNEMFSR
jgi:Skp family chaperone for outer membrane proteins